MATPKRPQAVGANKDEPLSNKRQKKTSRPEEEVDEAVDRAVDVQSWKDFAQTLPSGELEGLVKFADEPTDVKDIQMSDVRRKYGFVLKPAIMSGKRVLVVEHTSTFPFLELPAEVRNAIYECLLGEEFGERVSIRSHKPPHQPRRPTYWDFLTKRKHEGLTWDPVTAKWLNAPHSSAALLRVCQHFKQEVAPMLYGMTYEFHSYSDASLFLNHIGSMRRHVRSVAFHGHHQTKNTLVTLRRLCVVDNLDYIGFGHKSICADEGDEVRCFAQDIAGLVRFRSQVQAGNDTSAVDAVLQAVNIEYGRREDERCYYFDDDDDDDESDEWEANRRNIPGERGLEIHVEEVYAELSKAVRKSLRMMF